MAPHELTKALIAEEFILHLATSGETVPANCALEYVDIDGDLYWLSSDKTLHSRNIITNPDVAICITRTNPDKTSEGIQATGTAALIVDTETKNQVRELILNKIQRGRPRAVVTHEDTRSVWKFSPRELLYMNETVFGYDRTQIIPAAQFPQQESPDAAWSNLLI